MGILRKAAWAAVLTSSLAAAGLARANSVTVGGSLLDQSGANQLASWLGEGDLTITNIFSHTNGDGKTAADFHAAADNQGRTFSLYSVRAGTYNGYDQY
jgi:hypothetical protein